VADIGPGDTAEAGAMAKKGAVAEFNQALNAYLKKRGLEQRPYNRRASK
jgi:hypothetical protein